MGSADVVERYLKALVAQDWSAVAACLAEDQFERVGPFVDQYSDTTSYLEYLREIVPTLANYRIDIRRLVEAGDGTVVLAEISESFQLDGTPMAFPEALVFDVDGEGLINRIQVFMMRPAGGSDGNAA